MTPDLGKQNVQRSGPVTETWWLDGSGSEMRPPERLSVAAQGALSITKSTSLVFILNQTSQRIGLYPPFHSVQMSFPCAGASGPSRLEQYE